MDTGERWRESQAIVVCKQWTLPGCVKTGAFAAFPAFGWNDGDFRGLATLHLLVRIPHLVHLLPGEAGTGRAVWWGPYLNERRGEVNVRQGE